MEPDTDSGRSWNQPIKCQQENEVAQPYPKATGTTEKRRDHQQQGGKTLNLPKDIQKEFEDKEDFTLKDIQERKRQYHISQEVKDVLNTPMPTTTPEKEEETEIKKTKTVTCPECGEEFEVEIDEKRGKL